MVAIQKTEHKSDMTHNYNARALRKAERPALLQSQPGSVGEILERQKSPIYRVWRDCRASCYYINTTSAIQAVEAIADRFPATQGWRAEPDKVAFTVVSEIIYDRDGKPLE